ncbi:MAG: NAD(P)/FAD-dependent oxidoreductase [Cyanobacteria bacterium SZAS LIN-2]|nr:NAD(P)/FAD-dependent oxidoreductase [Cyanobacteria bacterium SZAS LIN-2]
MTDIDQHWQVVIIGAGPAGATCAFLLAKSGKKVLLVDRATFPRAKVCGSCLSHKTIEALQRAGLSERADLTDLLDAAAPGKNIDTPAIKNIKLCTAGGTTTLPLRTGRSVSRELLDWAIIKRAQAAGAVFIPACSASVLPSENADYRTVTLTIRSDSLKTVRADCAVIADGINGQALAQLSGEEGRRLAPVIARGSRIGTGTVIDGREVSSTRYQNGTIYMAVHKSGYVGIVRLEDEKIDLGAAFDLDFVRACGSPQAAARKILESCNLEYPEQLDSGHWLGTAPFTRKRKTLGARRLFVIGDAASYGEPFTGEGIGWAINSALLAVPHILAATVKWEDRLVSLWQKDHKQHLAGGQQTSRQLGALLRTSELTNRLIDSVLVKIPGLSQILSTQPEGSIRR